MAILAQCPICRRKQSVRNKKCIGCGEDIDKLKRQKGKVLYWVDYRLPNGRQRREPVGCSIEEARDAEGLRRAQKRQNNFFDMIPERNWTFNDLKDWYLAIDKVKKTKTFSRIELALTNFAEFFDQQKITTLQQLDIERYQNHREKLGRAAATIDMEFKYAKAAVKKAFFNEKVDGRILRAFENTKLLGKKGENARDRTINFIEYLNLLSNAPKHLKNAMIVAFHTGMRKGEILGLEWNNVDDDLQFIRLEESDTKEGKSKIVPLNHHVRTLFSNLIKEKNGHPNVITYYGKPITQKDALKKSLSTTCKKAELPYGTKTDNGIIFHDFRRSFKTNMVLSGVAEPIADTILGHSLLGMNKHYIKPNEDSLMESIEIFTKWLDPKIAKAKKELSER